MADELLHALYRMYDETGQLMYVGISVDPGRRFVQHRSDKPWWDQVVNFTVQPMPTRKAALAAEKDAIKSERPLFNVVHNDPSDRPQMQAGESDAIQEDLRHLAMLVAYRALSRTVYALGGDPECADAACESLNQSVVRAIDAYMGALDDDPMSAAVAAAWETLPIPVAVRDREVQ